MSKALTVEELGERSVRTGVRLDCPVWVAIRPSAYADIELWHVALQPSWTSGFVAFKDSVPSDGVTFLNTVGDLLAIVATKRDRKDYSATPLSFCLRSGSTIKSSSNGYNVDIIVPTQNGLHLSLMIL